MDNAWLFVVPLLAFLVGFWIGFPVGCAHARHQALQWLEAELEALKKE
jgi:hypothetical protein